MDSLTIIAIVILFAVFVIGIGIKLILSRILKNMDGMVGVVKTDKRGKQVLHVNNEEKVKSNR